MLVFECPSFLSVVSIVLQPVFKIHQHRENWVIIGNAGNCCIRFSSSQCLLKKLVATLYQQNIGSRTFDTRCDICVHLFLRIFLQLFKHLSFSVINKVGSVGIFVQLPMDINWKQFRAWSKFIFVTVFWIIIWSYRFLWLTYFRICTIKKCQHCLLCVLWENLIVESVRHLQRIIFVFYGLCHWAIKCFEIAAIISIWTVLGKKLIL